VLVDRLPSDHAEREHELAPAVEQDPRARGEILDPRDRVPLDREAPALFPQLVDRGGCHVVTGEGRVDDPDPLQAFRFRRREGGLRHDRLVLELPRGAVARDDDPQLVAELPRLAEKVHMTGMEEIEDPRRHYADHERHARTMSCPSRNTRFLARAYAFASSFETACPSSAIISQIVAVGARPAMIMSAVVSSV